VDLSVTDASRKAEWTRDALELAGFVGWHPFGDLPSRLGSIDRGAGGVYVVYRDTLQPPGWLDRSPAGTWRGDPTVPHEVLVANWVEGATVVNIGKANHGQLSNRLRAYCSFGTGGKGRHYGGRLIWQLKDSADLLVAWRVITDLGIDPRKVEKGMIDAFRSAYGKRPFANLSD
jgi:hypothetical protein